MTAEQRVLAHQLKLPRTQHPLLNVMIWELRRLAANPWNWAAAAAAFIFFLVMVWLKHAWTVPVIEKSLRGIVVGTSNVGLLFEFINVLLLVFALMLPFVVTDSVARDHKQRMHEILMATPIPTWAYVWGRFLATLCVSLGLAVAILVAQTGMSHLLAQLHPADIPAPDFGNSLMVWAVVIVPPTIFLTGVGFSLGTLWPRRSSTMMLVMLVGWISLFTMGYVLFDPFNHLYMYLDPTSTGVLSVVYPHFVATAQQALKNVPVDQQAGVMLQLQRGLPDLSGWMLPHYEVAVVGVVLAGLAAARFKRFRDVLS